MSEAAPAGSAPAEPPPAASRPWSTRSRWPLLAGLLCWVVAFPPVGAWPLAALVPVLLAAGARAAPTAGAAFRRVALVGLLAYLIGMHWIAETAVANLVMVACVEGPLVGLFGWAAWRALPGRADGWRLPVLWVGAEMLRFVWPLSGLTWMGLGHAFAASPQLVQVASLGGVSLVSLVAAVGGVALVGVLRHGPRKPWVLGLTVLVAALVYGLVAPELRPEPRPGPLVATLQPAFPQALKDDQLAADLRWDVLMELVGEVAAAGESPDLLVFPETMWPYPPVLERPERLGGVPADLPADELMAVTYAVAQDQELQQRKLAEVRAAFAEDPPHVLVGTLLRYFWGADPDERGLANGALLFAPDGALLDGMEKSELVPGGETLPLIGWMPPGLADWYREKVRDFAGYVPDLLRGEPPRPLQGPGGSFGVTICYENAYGGLGRRLSERGADWLINLSNEGWFGRSAEFDHMELQSVLRAVEAGRALYRSTNSGISGLVLPDGRPSAGPRRLEVGGRDREVRGVFRARVPLHAGGTAYLVLGDAVGWVALLAAVGLALAGRRGLPSAA